jgi:hypothetical protein
VASTNRTDTLNNRLGIQAWLQRSWEGLGGLVKFGWKDEVYAADNLRQLWWLPVKEEPSPLTSYIDSAEDLHVFPLEKHYK